MKKIHMIFAAAACLGVMTVAAAGTAMAATVIMGGALVEENDAGPGIQNGGDASSWATAAVISGPVLQVNDEYILMNSVPDNESGPVGMVSLRVDPDLTLIADAADGYPLTLSDIQEGETVYAYTGAAMTLSLPPQLSASMIIAHIPEDGSVPLFIKTASLTDNGDGTYTLTVAGGAEYTVPSDCRVRPFRTRNIVLLTDVNPGSNCLIWYDEQNVVSMIVIIQQ